MQSKKWEIQVVVLCLCLSVGSACLGKVIYVDADAAGSNNGSSWENAYFYLQDALADANIAEKPVEIRVAQGIYRPDENALHPEGTGNREATFQLINGVTLKGGYAGLGEPDPNVRDTNLYETVLSGDLDGNDVEVTLGSWWELSEEPSRAENSYHVVTGSGTNLTAYLDGFVVTGGYGDMYEEEKYLGGGLYNHHGNPSIRNCVFQSNFAGGGGGICNVWSNPEIENCEFLGNASQDYGGAIYNYGGEPTVMNCTFTKNCVFYEYGDGIFNGWEGCAFVTGCLFIQNGTAIYNFYNESPPRITDCIFVSNGTGIYNHNSSPIVVHSLFVANSSAGILNIAGDQASSNPFVVNSTFTGNSSSGICSDRFSAPTVRNCILWDNRPNQISRGSESIVVAFSDVEEGYIGSGNIDVNPCFANPGYWAGEDPEYIYVDSDFHVKSRAGRYDPKSATWISDDITSPCIDAGDPASPIGDEPFPNGGRINMGAYGGTVEASKSYFDKPPCETIVAGDINGDCAVDFRDAAIMFYHWLEGAGP